jgi:hypothetical protein
MLLQLESLLNKRMHFHVEAMNRAAEFRQNKLQQYFEALKG